jgi:hypothetical protein
VTSAGLERVSHVSDHQESQDPSMTGERSMTRQLFLFRFPAFAAALLLGAAPVFAVEMPARKPGLWEMKLPDGTVLAWRGQPNIEKTSPPAPGMTMQHCTDETTDKQMNSAFLLTNESCSTNEIQKTATGYIIDAVCTVGSVSMTSHAEITGDFDSAYTIKYGSQSQGDRSGAPRNPTTIEAKWLGACKPDQKPGDIVMPRGYKMNVKDTMKGPPPK